MILWDILAFPFVAPVQGSLWVIGQIHDQVMAELYDPDRLRNQLIQLQVRYELGNLAETEYLQQAAQVWERLKLANEMQVDTDNENTNSGGD